MPDNLCQRPLHVYGASLGDKHIRKAELKLRVDVVIVGLHLIGQLRQTAINCSGLLQENKRISASHLSLMQRHRKATTKSHSAGRYRTRFDHEALAAILSMAFSALKPCLGWQHHIFCVSYLYLCPRILFFKRP